MQQLFNGVFGCGLIFCNQIHARNSSWKHVLIVHSRLYHRHLVKALSQRFLDQIVETFITTVFEQHLKKRLLSITVSTHLMLRTIPVGRRKCEALRFCLPKKRCLSARLTVFNYLSLRRKRVHFERLGVWAGRFCFRRLAVRWLLAFAKTYFDSVVMLSDLRDNTWIKKRVEAVVSAGGGRLIKRGVFGGGVS